MKQKQVKAKKEAPAAEPSQVWQVLDYDTVNREAIPMLDLYQAPYQEAKRGTLTLWLSREAAVENILSRLKEYRRRLRRENSKEYAKVKAEISKRIKAWKNPNPDDVFSDL